MPSQIWGPVGTANLLAGLEKAYASDLGDRGWGYIEPVVKEVDNDSITVHTTPETAGKIFRQTQPRMAAYSHIVMIGGERFGSEIPAPTTEALVRATRRHWDGPLQVGEDLMRFTVSASGVTVAAWQNQRLQ